MLVYVSLHTVVLYIVIIFVLHFVTCIFHIILFIIVYWRYFFILILHNILCWFSQVILHSTYCLLLVEVSYHVFACMIDAANTVSFFLPVSLLFVSRVHNYFRYGTREGGGGGSDRKQMCNCIFFGVTAKKSS